MNNIIKSIQAKLRDVFIKPSVAIPEAEEEGNARLPGWVPAYFQECEAEVQRQLGVSLKGIFSSNSTASDMLAELEKVLNAADLSAIDARYKAERDAFLGRFGESLQKSAYNVMPGDYNIK